MPKPKPPELFLPVREIEVAPFLEVIQGARIAVPQRRGDRLGELVPGVFLLSEAFQVFLKRPVAGRDPIGQEGLECLPRRDPMPRGVHEQIEVTLRTQRFLILLGKVQCTLGKLRPLPVPARHEQKLRVNPEVIGVFGVGFDGLFADFFGAVVVVANLCKEESVDAEEVGIIGVGFDGLFVDFFGAVVVRANLCEEESVDAEEVGIIGVGFDGLFADFFGAVVSVVNVCKEDGVVA